VKRVLYVGQAVVQFWKFTLIVALKGGHVFRVRRLLQ